MRAVVLSEGSLTVQELDDPVPLPGQLVGRVLACGICGSDLHARHHAHDMVAMSEMGDAPAGMPSMIPMDPDRPVVMGHEFCVEVVACGDNTAHRAGDVVVSMPVVLDPDGLHPVGYSNRYPGAYGDLVVLNDFLALDVPNGLDPHLAALTEPLAVAVHAVERSVASERHAAVVLGCGPIGLLTIAALRRKGVEPVVAADLSPARRALASRMGAHEVVDPRDEPAVAAWRRVDGRRPLVIVEAVGVPGMIDAALRDAPAGSQLLVVGVCMVPDTITPMVAVAKELNLQFVIAYQPNEFADALALVADGTVDVAPLVTGTVGLDGVADAFDALADPDAHAKVLVVPGG